MQRPSTRAREFLERLLLDNLLPFWEAHAIDDRDGGYRLNHDARGRWRGVADKFLVAQARTLWFFSRIARSPYQKESHLRAARHGYDFLSNRMLDVEHGGFYWRVSSSGQQVVESGKHLYGQAFALFALSEYAATAGDPGAAELARRLFQVLDAKAYDIGCGGYREFFTREWSTPKSGRGYLGHEPFIKTMNTHIHLLEAVTRYVEVVGDHVALERLRELRVIISEKVVREDAALGAFGVERHERDWTALAEPQDLRASYGHDVETAWLLMNASLALVESEAALFEVGRALFAHALRFGFDLHDGGFYESGRFGMPADRRIKLWWVQAEGMLGALRLYRISGEPEHARCFLKTLDWVVRRQADWRNGEWHPRVDERGRGSGDKAGPWKAPYHSGRAVIECLDLLKTLELPFTLFA